MSISTSAVWRKSGSTAARSARIRSRSAAHFPNGLSARCSIRAKHDVDGRAEQDDRVEATVELPLVRPAPADEEMTRAVPFEELGEPVLAPHPLRRAVVSRRPPAPVLRIGVDDTMATAAERRQCRRLPRTGHARYEHLRHRREPMLSA